MLNMKELENNFVKFWFEKGIYFQNFRKTQN